MSQFSPRSNGHPTPPLGGEAVAATRLTYVGKTFSALGIPAYRFLWLSMIASFGGMQMQMIARGYLAYKIGGTASSIAIVSSAFAFPMLFFSLIGGAVADRFERRKLMIVSQAGTAVVALSIAVLVQTGTINLTYLFIAGMIQGIIFSFAGPARQAFIPEVVGEKELLNAIALNSAGMNLTSIAGPSLAGALIAVPWIDIEGVFFVQAVLNVVALALLFYLPIAAARATRERDEPAQRQALTLEGAHSSPGPRASMRRDLVDGLRYVASSPILLTLLLMGLVPSLIGMSYQSFLPIFAKDVFGDGVSRNATGLGFMMTMVGVGALIGSLAVASMQDYPRRTQMQLIAGLGYGLGIGFFAIQGNFLLAIAGLVTIGLMSNFFMALNSTLIMTASDPQFYGRVMSVNMMTFALMPLGTLPAGFIADAIGHVDLGPLSLIGVQATTFGAGLIIVIFILGITLLNPKYRKLEQDDFKRFAVVAAGRVSEGQPDGAWKQLRRAFKQDRGAEPAPTETVEAKAEVYR